MIPERSTRNYRLVSTTVTLCRYFTIPRRPCVFDESYFKKIKNQDWRLIHFKFCGPSSSEAPSKTGYVSYPIFFNFLSENFIWRKSLTRSSGKWCVIRVYKKSTYRSFTQLHLSNETYGFRIGDEIVWSSGTDGMYIPRMSFLNFVVIQIIFWTKPTQKTRRHNHLTTCLREDSKLNWKEFVSFRFWNYRFFSKSGFFGGKIYISIQCPRLEP